MRAQISLVDMPDFSFDLDVLGGDITLLPGLEAWLNNLIRSSVLRCAPPPRKAHSLPATAQPSPAQPSPAQPSPAHVMKGMTHCSSADHLPSLPHAHYGSALGECQVQPASCGGMSMERPGCARQCRPYVLPDKYTVRLTDSDLGIETPKGILFVRLCEAQNVPRIGPPLQVGPLLQVRHSPCRPACPALLPRPYTLPDRYCIDLAPNGGALARPRGMLCVKLVEARHVPRTDFFGSTDPLVK